MNKAIEVVEVSKVVVGQSGQLPILSEVSCTIAAGEMVAIMGPSGSGKSTLMNIFGLLDRPTKGSVSLFGVQVPLTLSDSRLAALRSTTIGFVFQSFQLLPRLSVLANVLLPASYTKGGTSGKSARAKQLLQDLGLGQRLHWLPSRLSGGERQRVAIARALMNNPDIVLADEPTGNLDSKSGAEVLKLLTALHKQGKTVVLVTHDAAVAAQCQRTISMQDGRIIKKGGV
jgi:putative ABC transport system ATP-binding protein